MRVAIAFLLVTLPAAAQTATDDDVQRFFSNVRACVRANAPAAPAAGIRTHREAIDFFDKACLDPIPPTGLILGGPAPPVGGPLPPVYDGLPPGTMRRVFEMTPPGKIQSIIAEEWAATMDGR